jgi:hypothetical protein
MEAGIFGPLPSLSLEGLVARGEARLRMARKGIGDALTNEFDVVCIRDEIKRRLDEKRPVS